MPAFSWRTVAIAAPAALALGSAVAIVWLCLPGTGESTGEIENSATAEIPEPVDVASIGHVPVDPDDNAFEFYRKASPLVQPMSPAAVEQQNDAALEEGWRAIGPDLRAWLEQNRQALDLFRLGSDCHEAVYWQPADLKLTSDMDLVNTMRHLTRLAQLEVARALDDGDPDAAWLWCRVIFRASRHAGLHGAVLERLVGHAIHSVACREILHWATDPAVDSKMLRSALSETRSTYQQTAPASRTLQIEYLMTVATMRDRSLARQLVGGQSPLAAGPVDSLLQRSNEPALSIRVVKLAFGNWLRYCDLPRPRRPATTSGELRLFRAEPDVPSGPSQASPDEIEALLERTLLAKQMLPVLKLFLLSGDRETAKQGLLELALAAQCHYREYGAFPETIQPLAEAGFVELPVDPFGHGEPLHYRLEPDGSNSVTLWSIGPDETDDDGKVDFLTTGGTSGDMIYRVEPPRKSDD